MSLRANALSVFVETRYAGESQARQFSLAIMACCEIGHSKS
jgi:hypothetical protein